MATSENHLMKSNVNQVVVEKRHEEIKGRQTRVNSGIDEASRLELALREQKQHTDRTLKVRY